MDYGDRQDRAEILVQSFRESVRQYPVRGELLSGPEVANEIEQMTDLGRDLVAVAGLVLYAMNQTPEFFKNP